jgi:ABC-type Mn2+/Zn2+ transport system permease subunit
VTSAIVAASMMAIACSALSVFVIARRWAFIGEGISHAGLGGAGTAWMLMLIFPALVRQAWVMPMSVVLFCVATAVAIGYFSRTDRVKSDAAIGIFLVASLAWGIMAREIYVQYRHVEPIGFGEMLFGRLSHLAPAYARAAIVISAGVLLILAALGKEILYYCFDPQMAAASGVRAGFIHYLLMILLALTIVVGIPVLGSVMMTALLVLPGAAAGLVTRDLKTALMTSCLIALVGVVAGALVSFKWTFLPSGPAIVLVLFVEFVITYFASHVLAQRTPAA